MLADQLTIVERGREPGLQLSSGSRDELASTILERCDRIAELLDCAYGGSDHQRSCNIQRERVGTPGLTPSARVLSEMSDQNIPFFRFAMNASLEHKANFDRRPLSGEQLAQQRTVALESIKHQSEIEQADTVDFATFLEGYLRL